MSPSLGGTVVVGGPPVGGVARVVKGGLVGCGLDGGRVVLAVTTQILQHRKTTTKSRPHILQP